MIRLSIFALGFFIYTMISAISLANNETGYMNSTETYIAEICSSESKPIGRTNSQDFSTL